MVVNLCERALTTSEFSEWLTEKVRERGIDVAHFAAYADDTPYQTASRWLSGENNPGPANCYKIAKAIRREPDEVLARAGHLKIDPHRLEGLDLAGTFNLLQDKLEQTDDARDLIATEMQAVRERLEQWRAQQISPPEQH